VGIGSIGERCVRLSTSARDVGIGSIGERSSPRWGPHPLRTFDAGYVAEGDGGGGEPDVRFSVERYSRE
jgi:hypothetical protein